MECIRTFWTPLVLVDDQDDDKYGYATGQSRYQGYRNAIISIRESFVRAQRVYGNAIIKHRREITLADKWISIISDIA